VAENEIYTLLCILNEILMVIVIIKDKTNVHQLIINEIQIYQLHF